MVNVLGVKFVTKVQSQNKWITIPADIKRILGIFEDTDLHDLVIEINSAKGTKIQVMRTASGGEITKNFNEHIELDELVTVCITKVG
ncbi:hypothetical protein [Neisseria sp. 83E34]|uniref:hypothetical protein n=1 Tax=Neisseria sp. 83E34 TaxID=1692264 RepID=UPI0006CE6D9C|nr:hypothetical protein [Neisseria sp. 83E34]KPN71693.1 hypothetical protein AKG09_05235 [Neisseria sp. 83E34]